MGNNNREEITKIVNKKWQGKEPLLSCVIVDSRSDSHPDWVVTSVESALKQNIPVEVIVVDNVGRGKSIGKCFNQGVQEATCDWVYFQGDDDYTSFDLAELLWRWANDKEVKKQNMVRVSTAMIAFDDETEENFPIAREWTGCWKRDYLLKHPFNEKLKRGVDRELVEETQKRNEMMLFVKYYHGYYYRKHKDYSCAGDIIFTKPDDDLDFYFICSHRIFLKPITDRISKHGTIYADTTYRQKLGEKAKVIWCEWANKKAIDVSHAEVDAKKILRVHAFEVFTEYASNINWNGFDHVIFIDDYIKEYAERQFGKIDGAIVIPNGVDLNRFTLPDNKFFNNKIAYTGYLTRKKGIGELVLIAESLPNYEFHIAGKYQENDIADWFKFKKPDNIFIHPWQYDEAMNEFYQDKSFVLNTSMRESQAMTICEGMACGCKPLVRNWIGADEVYKEEWVYKNIQELKYMLQSPHNPKEYRDFVAKNYNFENTYKEIEKLLDVKSKASISEV